MTRFRRRKISGDFASGIATPVRVDGDGGFVLAEGDAYIQAQVFEAISPSESDNPYSERPFLDAAIFENPDDIAWQQIMRRRIVEAFAPLEENLLARLVEVEFGLEANAAGEYDMSITYINLESTESKDVKARVTSGGNQVTPVWR